jgi:hypothetical protein
MSIASLLTERARLQGEAAPLREQLSALDEAVSELDLAEAQRDRLLREHDDAVAAALMSRRAAPEVDVGLDLSEIRYREAQHRARAALSFRPRVEAELAAINDRLSQLATDLEEQVWADYPRAGVAAYQAALLARLEFERCLAVVDGIALTAHQAAHAQGRSVEQHPAHTSWKTIAAIAGRLIADLGSGAVRDFKSGPELLVRTSEGRATLGDLAPFLPPSSAAVDGSEHINRGPPEMAEQAPVAGGMANPYLATPDAAAANGANSTLPGGVDEWLSGTPTWMPAPRPG